MISISSEKCDKKGLSQFHTINATVGTESLDNQNEMKRESLIRRETRFEFFGEGLCSCHSRQAGHVC